jgi:Domain of unknown function (DUF4167)
MRNNNQKRMRGRHNNNNQRRNQNPLTRVYESNGPDVKIRGTANHVAEKYLQLARDAQGSGDPVAAENYYQHAEHYFRLIAAAQEQFRQQNPQFSNQQQPQQNGAPQQGGDENFDGDDGDDQPIQGEPHAPRGDQQSYMPRDAQPFPNQQQPYQQGGNRPPQQNFQTRPQPQPQPQPQGGEGQDFGGLPSFITGGQENGQQHQGNNGGDQFNDRGGQNRYGRHRRRHRGPRPEGQGGQQNQPYNQGGPGEGNDQPGE